MACTRTEMPVGRRSEKGERRAAQRLGMCARVKGTQRARKCVRKSTVPEHEAHGAHEQ